jgi:predicted DNA-binding protein
MSDKINLCAMLPRELYEKVTEERGRREQTLSQYVEQILTEHFEGKVEKNMSTNTRTLAFQVTEELFQRIKEYLKQNGLTQREFVVGLIEQALDEWENADETNAQEDENG